MAKYQCKTGHDYSVLRENWLKLFPGAKRDSKIFDQSVVFSTLFCKKCGDTKEVIVSETHQPKAATAEGTSSVSGTLKNASGDN